MAESDDTQPKEESIKLAEKEHAFLRNELLHLKDCQVRFLTFSVTATAIILGMIDGSDSKVLSGKIWLIPLAVLLPAWWIFFDKATTITRIVGYFRWLEKIILEKSSSVNFLGWENALKKFREQNPEEKIKIGELFKILRFGTTHRYWVITYYIFFFLSLVCLMGGYKQSNLYIIIPIGGLILFSARWNARVLWSLINGKSSYDKNEEKWGEFFNASMKEMEK